MRESLVDQARRFATSAHQGQVRKYTGEPYIRHPEAVVALLVEAGITDEATLSAAWLHDVVEDCDVAIEAIAVDFGAEVAALVFALTDGGPELGNRAQRKALDRARLSEAPAAAQTIKIADLIDNTKSIVERDPHFAKTYMREKAALLPMLTRGDKTLWNRAAAMLADYENAALSEWLRRRPHA